MLCIIDMYKDGLKMCVTGEDTAFGITFFLSPLLNQVISYIDVGETMDTFEEKRTTM